MYISIITCSNANNYGAILQTFALYYHISMLGHKTEVLDYRPPYLEFSIRRWYNARYDIKEWCKVFLRFNERSRLISKYTKIRKFATKHIIFSPRIYSSIWELRTTPPSADIFIAGSDQIWNPNMPNGVDMSFFLDFGSLTQKRISYAASFAVEDLPNPMQHVVKDRLCKLDYISVRERSGQRICDKIGIASTLVCDPVLLHPCDFWKGIADYSFIPDYPYILVYDFMKSSGIRFLSKKISSQRHLRIISVSPYYLSYAYSNFCDCSPEQFLALIDKAQCVICNSLHGCIFSVIFRKDFFVISRPDGLNTRMSDFLSRYGLSYRMDNYDDTSTYIDYDFIHHKLDDDISFSKLWLYNCLK